MRVAEGWRGLFEGHRCSCKGEWQLLRGMHGKRGLSGAGIEEEGCCRPVQAQGCPFRTTIRIGTKMQLGQGLWWRLRLGSGITMEVQMGMTSKGKGLIVEGGKVGWRMP